MECVYKREGILFKILPCMLISIYLVMCLFGSFVCAADSNNDDKYKYTVINRSDLVFDLSPLKDLHYLFVAVPRDDSYNPSFTFVLACSPTTLSIGDINSVNTIPITSESAISLSNGAGSFSDIQSYINSFAEKNYSSKPGKVSDYFNNYATNYGQYTYEEVPIACNYDVVSISDNSNVVFQGASQELATIIRPQVEGIQLQEIIQEIIQLLPVILVVIVALIAIRKAIHLLLKVLRNS